MPEYVVYRPSVMRSGRLGVRAVAVAALLVAALVAFVVVTRTDGASQEPSSARAVSKAPTAQTAASGSTAASLAHALPTTSTKSATTSHVAKTTVKPAVHTVKKAAVKPKAHAIIPPPKSTPVAVLNGGTAQGAAATLAARLRSLGYPVPVVGNAGRRDLPMVIEYAAGLGPAARALARHVGSVQYVTPLEGPNRNLAGARLLVIVGT